MADSIPNYRGIVHCTIHGEEDYTARELAAYVNASVQGEAHRVGVIGTIIPICPGEVIISQLGSVRRRNAKHVG